MSVPYFTIETITPIDAQRLLADNVGNRKLRAHVVARYASEIRAGEWKLTGDPISITADGNLLNGQHRLTACVVAGCSFQTAVLWNADPSSFLVMDAGLHRSVGDGLAADGHKNANTVAAAARLVVLYRNRAIEERTSGGGVPRRDMLIEADTNREWYSHGSGLFKAARGFNPSASTAFLVILAEHLSDFDKAIEYCTSTIEGIGLPAGDPRLIHRNWSLTSRRAQNPTHLSAWIRARNAYANHQTRSVMRPWYSSKTSGPFPYLDEVEGQA
jgi:hypothetical protein